MLRNGLSQLTPRSCHNACSSALAAASTVARSLLHTCKLAATSFS